MRFCPFVAFVWAVSVTPLEPAVFALGRPAPQAVAEEPARWFRVVRVIDGDTFALQTGERVRLIGVNTPELHHPTRGEDPGAREAQAFARELLADQQVRLELDVQTHDRYGRVLAYVYRPDGTFVNAELVRQGYAQVMTVPPNVRHAELFVRLQREARTAKRGLWAGDGQD